MKLSKVQMADNRVRILEAAARLFRERGFADVSLAEVMAEVGLTHGAFYSHFWSKDDLIVRAVESALEGMTTDGSSSLSQYVQRYLTREHRDNPGDGCLYAALGGEAARSDGDIRHILTDALKRHLDVLTTKLPGSTAENRRRTAVAAWATLMGALVLSRH